MPTELTRVEDVLRSHLAGAAGVTDADVTVTCPGCSARQTLSHASIDHEGTDSAYTCQSQCQILLIVGDPAPRELPGRGHRYGPYIIRNVSEMEVATGSSTIKIAASPAALTAISGRTRKFPF